MVNFSDFLSCTPGCVHMSCTLQQQFMIQQQSNDIVTTPSRITHDPILLLLLQFHDMSSCYFCSSVVMTPLYWCGSVSNRKNIIIFVKFRNFEINCLCFFFSGPLVLFVHDNRRTKWSPIQTQLVETQDVLKHNHIVTQSYGIWPK